MREKIYMLQSKYNKDACRNLPCTNKIEPNLVFSIYFSVMFIFYTNTIIQLVAQIGILLYVVLGSGLFRGNILFGYNRRTNVYFYLMWFGLFVLWSCLSTLWAYDVYEDSKTLITHIRIFVICLAIIYSCSSKQKTIAILESFIVGCAIMGFVALITSPISVYGTTDFGNLIGQHRNQIGAVAAPLTFLCYYLYKEYNFRFGRVLSFFYTILTIITGSRSSIIQLFLVLVFLFLFTNKDYIRKLVNLGLLFGVFAFVIAALYFIPYFRDSIWDRLIEGIKVVLGVDLSETSALGREYYKEIAFELFLDRPWLGYGIDGFRNFLNNNPYYISGVHMEAVYSHCNYAEIAANYGVVGLLIWYVPIIIVIIWAIMIKNKTCWGGCLFAVFFSMVLLDFSRIPWETHLVMYLYVLMIVLIRFEKSILTHKCNARKKVSF